jgi:2'-5' RNA ligase
VTARAGEMSSDARSPGDRHTIGVAVPIPAPWAQELQRCRESFGDPQAWSIPTHVTLLPPTRIDARAMPEVEDHLRKIAGDEQVFPMQLCGTGSFQPVSPVVFVEVRVGGQACARIEGKVRSGPLDRPVDFPYHPHVTIAHDLPIPVLHKARLALADYAASFKVDGFSLYRHMEGVWRPARAFAFRPLA